MILRRQLKSQQGIGIIELMVSITIGLFILAGVVQLYLTSTQNVSAFEGSSRIQENARYTFARFEQDLFGAGNLGCFSLSSVRTLENRVFNLLAPQGGVYDFTSFIGGENDGGPGVLGEDSTDSLYLRVSGVGRSYPALNVDRTNATIRLEPAVASQVQAGQVMAISDCSSTSIFAVSSVNTTSNIVTIDTTTLSSTTGDPYNVSADLGSNYLGANSVNETYEGQPLSYVYFGSGVGAIAYELGTSAAAPSGSECGSTTPEYCALKRDGEEIVEGVEDLQIEYGWIETAGLKFADADTIEALGSSAAEAVWRAIDRVRVTITFNSINTATTNEGLDLLRRTYSRVYVMHNQLPVSL